MEVVLTSITQAGEPVSGGPTRASDNTVYLLRSMLFTGQYEAGQKLPPERQLAEELGTSRITVRAALKSLETLGFVSAKIGSRGGWWVVDATSLAECWRNWMRSNSHQIDAMLECGEAIETEIAARAALRRSSAQLATLQTVLERMKGAGSTIGPHYAFHQALARAGGNQYLEQAMTIVGNQMFLPSDRVMDDMDRFYRVHEGIVAALEGGDPDRAREAMKAHFQFSRHILQVED